MNIIMDINRLRDPMTNQLYPIGEQEERRNMSKIFLKRFQLVQKYVSYYNAVKNEKKAEELYSVLADSKYLHRYTEIMDQDFYDNVRYFLNGNIVAERDYILKLEVFFNKVGFYVYRAQKLRSITRSIINAQRLFRKRRQAATVIQQAVREYIYRPGGQIFLMAEKRFFCAQLFAQITSSPVEKEEGKTREQALKENEDQFDLYKKKTMDLFNEERAIKLRRIKTKYDMLGDLCDQVFKRRRFV